MLRRLIVICGAWTGLAMVGFPQENSRVSVPDAIAARQVSMDMSLLTLRSIENAIKAGGEARNQGFPAAVLAKWAKALPRLFPAGSGKGETSAETQALSTLSQDHDGFERAASDYASATAQLADLATANDTAGFTKQLEAVNRACNGCHVVYKQPIPAAHGKKP